MFPDNIKLVQTIKWACDGEELSQFHSDLGWD